MFYCFKTGRELYVSNLYVLDVRHETVYYQHPFISVTDQTEELRYKYVIVELFGAGCLPLFTTILQVCSAVYPFFDT